MPGVRQANLKRVEDKDPVAVVLASVVFSLPASESTPVSGFEEMTKVALISRSKPGEEL